MQVKRLGLAVLTLAALTAGVAQAGDGKQDKKAYWDAYEVPTSEELVVLVDQVAGFELDSDATPACMENPNALCEGESAEACAKMAKAHEKSYGAIGMALAKSDEAWKVVGNAIAGHFENPETSLEARGKLLDLIAYQPSKSGSKLAQHLYELSKDSFQPRHVLAFAENGSEMFHGKIAAYVAECKERGSIECVFPAAYLTMRGDDTGREFLLGAVKEASFDKGSCDQAFVAAAALASVGEKKPLYHLQYKAHGAVLDALDRGDLQLARSLALQAEFFGDAATYGKKMSLAYLDWKKSMHMHMRAAEVANAEQVFELIEKVTPAG